MVSSTPSIKDESRGNVRIINRSGRWDKCPRWSGVNRSLFMRRDCWCAIRSISNDLVWYHFTSYGENLLETCWPDVDSHSWTTKNRPIIHTFKLADQFFPLPSLSDPLTRSPAGVQITLTHFKSSDQAQAEVYTNNYSYSNNRYPPAVWQTILLPFAPSAFILKYSLFWRLFSTWFNILLKQNDDNLSYKDPCSHSEKRL